MSKDLNLFLDVIVDIFYNPIFKDSDIKTERKVVIEELKMYKDKHDRVLEEIINKKLYAGTSLEMPIIGTEENIKKFTKKDLQDFRNKFYSHNNSLLVVSGDFDIKL